MQLNLIINGNLTRFSKGDGSDQLGFEQFIRDHIAVLKEHSEPFYPSIADKQTYAYRLDDWLQKEINFPKDMIWIVELINQFDNPMSFNDIDVVLVPNVEYIKTLRTTYQSNRNKATRLGQ